MAGTKIGEQVTAITGVNFAIQSNVIREWVAGNYAPLPSPPTKVEDGDVSSAPAKEPAQIVKEEIKETPPSTKREPAKIVTDKKPFNWDELEATAAELGDLMGEMHKKVKNKFGR